MTVPRTIRVKLLSDDAGAVSLTPAVVQEMPTPELIELVVSKIGKDVDRVRRVLKAGTLVRGASRYRWEGRELEPAEIEELLAPFPDPEPRRPFEADRCSLVVLRFRSAPHAELEPKELARQRFLHRRSFWGALQELLESSPPQYEDYSYQERADCYRLQPNYEAVSFLQAAADLLVHSQLAVQLRSHGIIAIDFYVPRGND